MSNGHSAMGEFIKDHPVKFTAMVITGLLALSSTLIARYATEKSPYAPVPPPPAPPPAK